MQQIVQYGVKVTKVTFSRVKFEVGMTPQVAVGLVPHQVLEILGYC